MEAAKTEMSPFPVRYESQEMQFECSVEIDVPLELAAELFSNPANIGHWQPEFRSIERVEGEPGQPGTKTWMNYQSGKHAFILIETVRENNLPREFIGEYETPGTCWNTMHSTFESLSKNKTHYRAKIDYKMQGLMVKIMATVMPGMFRKQTQRYLDNFKHFAETHYSNTKT